MNPREFQKLAQILVLQSTPAEIRSAISRAYYAAFHVGAETLGEWGFSISRGPSGHGDVRDHLGNSGDGEIQRVASQLNDVHNARINADYRLQDRRAEDRTAAKLKVDAAKRIIAAIDACRSQPKRVEAVVQAIEDWKRKTGSR